VQVAHDGGSALEAFAHFAPDVVLLDIGMPEMDGYEVSRRIRQRPDYRDLLVIALTGWGQAQDRTRSKAAGFDHHIVKPPDIAKLRAILMAPPPAAPHAPTQSAVE
jgi:CheY-like chemotaxis protein